MALKVVELLAENVKRLKAVRIAPQGNVVVIGGENAQGKTSVLDCIEMAVAGSRAIPGEPVRRGESRGRISLDLGEIVVERTFDARGTKLVVRNAEGNPVPSPQALLDKLYSKVAFNPLEFAAQKPADQMATLKRIVELDMTDLDAKRNRLYEKRTEIGRVKDAAELRVTSFSTSCVTAPDVAVSVSDLLAAKDAADRANALVGEKLARVKASQLRLAQLRREIAEAEVEDRQASADADGATMIDVAPIIEKIKGAEAINQAVRDKQGRAKAAQEFRAAESEYARHTAEIATVDEEKAARMAAAKWPIKGLGFGDDGITFNGLPFEQASGAERLKVSLAIGMALNPKLRVLRVPDASLLDKASMKLLRETAEAEDFQMWVERVGDGDAGAVIIEDGEVVDHSGDV